MDINSPYSSKNMSVAVKINTKILSAVSPENVVNIVEENQQKLNNVNITTAIHRIAKICHRKPQKIAKILPKLKPLISIIFDKCGTFSGRQLANSTWGLSIMQYKDVEFYKKISSESRKKLNDFEPQHLAILVWSFATMNLSDRILFGKVALKAIIEIQKFSPQNLSNLAWAFAKMNYCEELLFKNIASQAVKTIKEFAPQNISNLIWSFGALKIGETELLEKIIDESLKRLEEFNTQNLSNLAWSLAQLVPASRYNDVLFEEVSAVCIIKTEYFNARYFSNLLWAFAVAGFFPEPLVERAIDYMNTAEPSELEDLGAAYKAQWYQVDLTLKLERPVFSRRVSLRKAILTLVSREFLKNEIVSSENSVEVNNILNFLQLDYSSNFILNEGFVVSNMLQPESQRVAVNFLGPHNFLKSSLEMSGESALRGRLLKEIGWKIAVIEHKELERCNNFEQKVRLVADRLLNVGIQIHDQILSPLIDCRQNEMVDFKKSDFFGDDGRLDSLAMGVSGKEEKTGQSILEGIIYKSFVKRYLKIFLYDVEIIKPLGGRFGEGFYFEMVEINLMDNTAGYFLHVSDHSPSFIHPIKIK